jgi:NAD(P)-dependent dehydrogenase (short-subunit alcohol dehydrogenase family)
MTEQQSDPRIAVLTGATDGLGRALAARLVDDGATLILHGRDRARIDETVRELRERRPGARIFPYQADLASLAEAAELASSIQRDFTRLDILINNAGIGAGVDGAPRQLSVDGYELRFAVNYLAGFALTAALLPLLETASSARIVNVASIGQSAIDFDDVMLAHGYEGRRAYTQSKLAQILFTFELAERLLAAGTTGVTVNAVHPSSLMPTKMVFESWGRTLSTIEQGVEAVHRLAMAPQFEVVSGRYFDVLEESRAKEQAYDPEARRRLWDLSEELIESARRRAPGGVRRSSSQTS